MIVLTYIGGGAYLPGVPACDLTADMVAASGMTEAALIASGLYQRPAAKPPAKGKEK